MKKNLVVCLDGTGNEFGDSNSNVVKLCQALHRDPLKQIVFYNPGIGTNPELYKPTAWGRLKHAINKVWDQATGKGVLVNASAAYAFLMEQYAPGDQIFIFGFSRGAYTARVLAALIHKFGILDRGNDNLVRYAVTLLLKKNKRNDSIAEGFKNTFGRDAEIHFIGVWDTVSSVRWFADPPSVPYTSYNPSMKTIRHAVALDERRANFRTNLFRSKSQNADIKEVWFPGVHADIGGGYPEAESGLGKISLKWMMREAGKAGLLYDEEDRKRILGESGEFVAPSAEAKMHNEHRSASNLWGLAGYIPKVVWDFKAKKRALTIPGNKARPVPNGSIYHQSVFERKRLSGGKYNPENLKEPYLIEE